jgi:hypothetical protein
VSGWGAGENIRRAGVVGNHSLLTGQSSNAAGASAGLPVGGATSGAALKGVGSLHEASDTKAAPPRTTRSAAARASRVMLRRLP